MKLKDIAKIKVKPYGKEFTIKQILESMNEEEAKYTFETLGQTILQLKGDIK